MRRIILALALSSLLASAPEAQQLPAEPNVEILQRPATSGIAELAGEDFALQLVELPVSPAVLREHGGAIGAGARSTLRAGNYPEAGRRFDIAARLERHVASLVHGDSAALAETRRTRATYLHGAVEAYTLAGDSTRLARALVELGFQTLDFRLIERALSTGVPLAGRDAVWRMLVYDRMLRLTRNGDQADSLFLMVCGRYCGALTSDESLRRILLAEMRRPGRSPCACGPVENAIRALIAAEYVGPLLHADELDLLIIGGARFQVPRAAATLVERGGVDAAELWLALAYVELRRDPELAVAAADSSLRLRGPGDFEGRSRAVALRGLALSNSGAVDSALAALRQADSLAASAAATYRSLIRRRLAVVHGRAGDSASARALLAEASAIRGGEGLAEAFDRHAVARAMVEGGHEAAALRLAAAAWHAATKDLPVEDRAEMATTLALAFRGNGQLDSASHYLRVASSLQSEVGLDLAAAQRLAAMSEIALERGDAGAAQRLLTTAATTAGRSVDIDRGLGARLMNDFGLIALAHARHEAALDAFAAARRLAGPSHSEFTEAGRGIAVAYAEAPRAAPDAAIDPVSVAGGRALTIHFTTLHPPRQRDRPLTESWVSLAAGIQELRAYNLFGAWAHFEDAAFLAGRSPHEPTSRRISAARAVLYDRIGRADSASFYTRLAGGTSLEGLRPSAGQPRPADVELGRQQSAQPVSAAIRSLQQAIADAESRKDLLGEVRALAALAQLHFRRRNDPTQAITWYDSASVRVRSMTGSAWSAVRQRWITAPDWIWVELGEQSSAIQEESVLAWLAREGEIGRRRAALAALAAADRGRAQALVVLARGQGTLESGFFGQVVERAMLGGEAAEVGESLLNGGRYSRDPHTTLSYLQTADTLITWIHRRYGADSDSIMVVRRPISRDSVANIIFSARASIGADSADNRSVPPLEPGALTRGAGAVGAAGAQEALIELSTILLPSDAEHLLSGGGDLLIVPSGPIAGVPFAALLKAEDEEPLGARFAVAYAPSLGLRLLARTQDVASRPPGETREEWLSRAVVIGNPTMPEVKQGDAETVRLSQLPGAEAEARSIASLIGVSPLVGDAATYEALRTRASTATILHLATHGYAYAAEEKVDDSFVALAPSANDDGLLTVADVLKDAQMRFPRAELVVLSACQTALGRFTRAEGTLGLQRAFLAAGAESMLVSLWSVSDEATRELLEAFYRLWLGGEAPISKAEALRRAQDELRTSQRFSHPRYWAAFQLVSSR